jgi:DNA-binding HxlR family transcriptional regulator
MHLLAGASTVDVIWFLREGERCFTELQHDIAGVSAKVLTIAFASWNAKES